MYIEEQSHGPAAIQGVPTSITVFIGRAPMGAVDEPVAVFSYSDYERLFGGLASGYPMSYAVQDFFANGGSQAMILRLFEAAPDQGSGVAELRFPDSTLVLTAASPGSWGNALSATVDGDALTLTYGAATERFLNVSFDADSPNSLERVLQSQSTLARVAQLSGASPGTGATSTGTGGSDGQHLSPSAYVAGIEKLDRAPYFNLLCIPPEPSEDLDASVRQAAALLCARRGAVYIVDPPSDWADKVNAGQIASITPDTVGIAGEIGRNAAVYFPRVWREDPLDNNRHALSSACGMIAGVVAATDASRGVWKAPAGQNAAIAGAVGLEVKLTEAQNGQLNPLGINCLRQFPVYGTVIWGARTVRGADVFGDDYKYLPVRRLMLYVEESVRQGIQWAVFEPNNETLWSSLRLVVQNFLAGLSREGAFYGYFVKCDATTTTQSDIDSGIVNIVIGVAPLKPAEFVVIEIRQITGQSAS